MRWLLLFLPFSFAACSSGPDDPPITVENQRTVSPPATASATEIPLVKDSPSSASHTLPPVKRPSGIYQALLPYGDAGILHTVAFYPGTFRLQEEYLFRPDSVVVTEGTWAPRKGPFGCTKKTWCGAATSGTEIPCNTSAPG